MSLHRHPLRAGGAGAAMAIHPVSQGKGRALPTGAVAAAATRRRRPRHISYTCGCAGTKVVALARAYQPKPSLGPATDEQHSPTLGSELFWWLLISVLPFVDCSSLHASLRKTALHNPNQEVLASLGGLPRYCALVMMQSETMGERTFRARVARPAILAAAHIQGAAAAATSATEVGQQGATICKQHKQHTTTCSLVTT
jgi:hypothetical protein